MASLKEILAIEHSREHPNELHLFAEGTFWRAYEYSAWLCFRCINEFKVTKRHIKGVDTPVCFVGFPQTSLDKWISSFQVINEDKKHLIVSTICAYYNVCKSLTM